MQNLEEMIETINEYLFDCEFYYETPNCRKCPRIEECYAEACLKSSHIFAENINYGGYDSEEEFWENLD